MDILFIHNNFPGQFKHLAPNLAAQGHRVVALTPRVDKHTVWNGVQMIPYHLKVSGRQSVHPWLVDTDTKLHRAHACYIAALKLRDQGFDPKVIIAHPGWGESLFVKDVWPNAPLGLFCELYYHPEGGGLGFDPEFPARAPDQEYMRIRLKNLSNRLHHEIMDLGISPTQFQASSYPEDMRPLITVSHDGIDTKAVRPDPEVRLTYEGLDLTRQDEVITFVNRNLEPYRGYHVFMRALPRLLRERPNAQILIVGGDGVSYGAAAPKGKTWKQMYIDEVRDSIPDADWARVHFLGRIPYDVFLKMLQVTRVHVYLTYPFVLSWSLMEAMASEAAIVASDVAPVAEVIKDGETGRLVNFFDGDAMVDRIAELAEDEEQRRALGQAARKKIVAEYDLASICMPRQLSWVQQLHGAESRRPVD